jgi:regulation of enolase protein 1 (concanavalin A-like superfamily)
MIHTSLRVIALLGTVLLVGTATAQDAKSDSAADWGKFVDPDGDCKLKAVDGGLTITIPNTLHNYTHTDDGTKLNAPRILQDVKGDFHIQVKVEAFQLPQPNTSVDGKHSFVSAGLLLWHDDNNFVRLDRAAAGGNPFVWVEVFRNGISAEHKLQQLADKDTYLRLTRAGDKLTFESSADGKKWSAVHTTEFKAPAAVKVGGLAINTTTKVFAPKFVGMTLESK